MIKIRYNTNYPETSDKKWRLLIDGEQTLVDAISILVDSWSSVDLVKDDKGNEVMKYHICCEGSVNIIINNETNETLAVINEGEPIDLFEKIAKIIKQTNKKSNNE